MIFSPLNLESISVLEVHLNNASDILTNAYSYPILVAKYRVMPSVLNVTLSARMKLGRFIFLLVYIGERVWGYETLVAHKLHAVQELFDMPVAL